MATEGSPGRGDLSTRPAEDVPTQAVPSRGAESSGIEVVGEPRPAFAANQLVGDRYRIVRFIARGGMGEVYEAEDMTLHGTVALKTILPDVARNKTAVERFKREIQIARKITHPNVSRIYDIGTHRGEPDVMFLTMEFLRGETLHGKLAREGRLRERDAFPLAEQIAAGLAAAHECGIIHRDFKSANVMLVPGGSGVRAVVTDFGLARAAAAEHGMATISESGMVMGTPAYMAPEQVEGLRLTPAADIYAFGIVLYEMVTGTRPFRADTPLSTAVKRLTEAPVPPRQIVPNLDPLWDATILRCLARDPAARFDSAADAVRALRAGDTPTVVLSEPRDTRAVSVPANKRRAALLAGALAAAVLAVFGFVSWPDSRSASAGAAAGVTAPAVPVRHSVAVLGFRNNSGVPDASWLSTALSEMMATDLAAGGKTRVVPGEEIARAKADLGLSDSEPLSKEVVARIRPAIDADSVVTGSYTLVGEPGSRLLRIDTRLIDARSGETLVTSDASGTELQLFDLVSRVAGPIRQKLGVGTLTAAQSVELEASFPSNPEAIRLYTEGLSKLRSLDAAGARDLLQKAVAADEKHPLIRSALSAALSALGEEVRAHEEATRAVALAERLPREQKLLIEARMHEAAKDWSKAVEVERTLWESSPDQVEYGLNLANSQISAGRAKEALVTVAQMRKLPRPISADPRIDLAEARAYQELAEFEKQRSSAASAARKGRTSGSRLLVASARMLEATALIALGNDKAAGAAIDEARSLFHASSDRGGVARTLELTATLLHRQGDLAGERRLLEEALAIHRELSDRGAVARVLGNIGNVLISEGRSADAQKYFDESLSTSLAIQAKFAAAVTANNIGAAMFYLGDLRAAERRYAQALAWFGELGEKSGTAMTLTNIGEVLTSRGNLQEGRRMHEEALAMNRAIGDKGGAAYDLFRLGEIFALRGEHVAARDRYQQALALQTEIGDKLGAADSRVALAALDIRDGSPANAEAIARAAEEIQRTEGATDRSVASLTVLAESLLAQRKFREAADVSANAWRLASNNEDRRVRFAAAVVRAKALAASGRQADVDAALALLRQNIEEATKLEFVPSALEARLAAGVIEAASGRAGATEKLSRLQKDAAAKGFGSVARRAAAARA